MCLYMCLVAIIFFYEKLSLIQNVYNILNYTYLIMLTITRY